MNETLFPEQRKAKREEKESVRKKRNCRKWKSLARDLINSLLHPCNGDIFSLQADTTMHGNTALLTLQNPDNFSLTV